MPRTGYQNQFRNDRAVQFQNSDVLNAIFPSQLDDKLWDKNSRRQRNNTREVTTHTSIHTLHVDGLRELYRHFLRLPDGAIVEVWKVYVNLVDDGVRLLAHDSLPLSDYNFPSVTYEERASSLTLRNTWLVHVFFISVTEV